ncbi:TRAP transporter small permease [Halodesulfovibrio sp. MK-HDV]|uniref:TRAP transporter small permease n=1 Tax=unclassified Halodesulfovibrio TaxID=2644657 RepID=UPI00136F8033|nr:TRAP transporter small permease [Halodesulfovibrio sp. MK-HDV]KAF1077480.1 hypothetical protein MKHDV_00546 [Halodesulfovibrio sp. MK-HDV]
MSTDWKKRCKAFKDGWIVFFSYVLFLAITINFLEIVMRVLFNSSVDLMFDLPTWLTTWSMVLISGMILLDNEHLCIEAIRSKLSGKPAKVLDFINNLLTTLFAAIVTYSGIMFVKQLYVFDTAFTRIITIPKWMVEICIPIGMGVFTICAIIKTVQDLRKKYTDE